MRIFRRSVLGLAIAALVFTSAPAFAADTYEIDAVHSAFLFRVKHLGVSYYHGRFNEASGKFTIDAADATKNSIEIEVKADSIDTANAARDKHLKGPDFFNTVEFPTLSFKSTSFKKKDGNKFEVTGDLTIHGVTKQVTTQAELVGTGKHPKGGGAIAGWETSLVIKRSNYGMTYGLEGIGDDVTLTISIEGGVK